MVPLVWTVAVPEAVDWGPAHFVPVVTATVNQYVAAVKVPLVHEVVAIPLAAEVNPEVAEVVDL